MMDGLVSLKLPPGFYANGTKYQASGRWNEGNLIRFHEGAIGPIGGWVDRVKSGAAIAGTPIAAVCWQLADGTPFLAIGTTLGLYVIDNNDVCYDITPISTDIQASPYDWHLTTFGAYLVAVNSLLGDEDLSLVNTFIWTGDTTTKATPAWTSAVGPLGAYAAFATPERFLTVIRGQDPTTHTARSGVDTPYSERRVYWASQESLDGFVSTDTNTGGDFDIQTEGRLIVGAAARGQSLIWSDVDLWAMNYIGGDLIYSFQNVGRQCGIVSKRAFVITDKGAYWMGRGKFFIYDGFVRGIPCEVTDHVFGNFNEARASAVWAVPNPRFNEITWFYPAAGSQWADRYVTYNHAEDHWVFGELNRTAGVPQRFRRDVVDEPKPVWFDSLSTMFQHETGDSRTAQAWLTSGPMELGNGDRLMRIQAIVPDDKTVGDVACRLYTALANDALESLHGPFTLQAMTNTRITTRQVRVRLEEATAADWRVGVVRLAVRPVERRGVSSGPIDEVPASIEVVPAIVTLGNAQHYTFQAIIRNAAGEVLDIEPDNWTSDNAQVPIDTTGTVTALSTPQTAFIHASLVSPALTSNAAECDVIGDNVPASIELAPTSFDIIETRTQQLTWIVRNAAGQIITGRNPDDFVSSDVTKSTVTSGGLVTGVGTSGTSNIVAHIYLTTGTVTSNAVVATCVDPYITHTFGPVGGSYSFVVTDAGDGSARALLVAGGGSGGSVDGSGVAAGGGGGGGVIDQAITLAATTYPLAVGIGGVRTFADHSIGAGSATGLKGGNTTGFGLTASGGGAGLSHDAAPTGRIDGGSGGGSWSSLEDLSFPPGRVSGPFPGGTAVAGQGHVGGSGVADPTSSGFYNYGGGGGGAGTAGSDYNTGGVGGDGRTSDITGVATYYGGGGGAGWMGAGAGPHTGGPGGLGGGAHGGGQPCDSGTDGLGGGGGGGSGTIGNQGGNGGNGIIIVRYRVASGIVATGGTMVTHS